MLQYLLFVNKIIVSLLATNVTLSKVNQNLFFLFEYQFTQTLTSLTIEFYAHQNGIFQLIVRIILRYLKYRKP